MIQATASLIIDPDEVIADKVTFDLPDWCATGANCTYAAQEIVERYAKENPEFWPDHFGIVTHEAKLQLVIHMPRAIAGTYDLDIQHELHVYAKRRVTTRDRSEGPIAMRKATA